MELDSNDERFRDLLKRGNTSSATAAIGNTGIAIVKGAAAIFTGSGAMFASTMHSIADAVNQAFVFAGSVLAEKNQRKNFRPALAESLTCSVWLLSSWLQSWLMRLLKKAFICLLIPLSLTDFC